VWLIGVVAIAGFILYKATTAQTEIEQAYPWFTGKAIIIAAIAAIFVTYTVYIDRKATYRERAKWEEKARIAKKAADDQDTAAEQRGRKQAQVTIDYLKQQKALDDAAIEQLKEDLKKPREAPEPGTRQLPAPPEYLQPQYAPKVREGDNMLIVAKQRGQIIKRQNRIITDTRKWIEGVRETYKESFIPKNIFGF
ncbi:hypothetical protein KXX11_003201, partial [Aspergillus fumigatus]